MEMEAGLREIFPCKYFDQETYNEAFQDELGDWEKRAMEEKEMEVSSLASMVDLQQAEYEKSIADQFLYTELLEVQLDYAVLRKTNVISKVMKMMKELQLVTLQMEKVRARLETEKKRSMMFMTIHKDFLSRMEMKTADKEEFEIRGVAN